MDTQDPNYVPGDVEVPKPTHVTIKNDWDVDIEVDIEELHRRFELNQDADKRRREYADQQITALRRERNKAERETARTREALRQALQEAHGDKAPFTADSDEVAPLLVKAFRVARLIGHNQEGYAVAEGLNVLHLWEQSSNTERSTGTIDERNAEIGALVERTTEPIHPLDPRAQAVWKQAHAIAQSAGMCEEFETVAEHVGIPTDFEFKYEGYVNVRFNGYASIPVSGWATRAQIRNGEAYEIDSTDVVEHADHYNIDWEIDEEEIDIED